MNHLENYLRELRDIRSSGAGVKETSYYGALANLLNEVGKTLKPKVRCIINLRNQGAGIPDGGLFTADQFQKSDTAEPLAGTLPARGAIEVKGTSDDAFKIADSDQVKKYLAKYGQVLVTNLRDFVLVGKDGTHLESYRLAPDEKSFWTAAANPEALSKLHAERFTEYLKRVMLSNAPLENPKDVAWFLASYARDAKARIELAPLDELATIRAALEEALGVKFEGEKGLRFFRSTLVQTLFYGVFSAWVLWCKTNSRNPNSTICTPFDWYSSARYLRVPILRKLFHLISEPGQLDELNLSEALDWAAAALNRVNHQAFFAQFNEGEAVQYFYEPFLEAFDPELRKELGVWYTPIEIVKYMVERVDTVLRTELNRPDGLADPDVYVLDPCCGTGAYLVEVLNKIAETLQAKGDDASLALQLKKAAMERVFGFEILPAPFVVAHLQIGLLLQHLGAAFGTERDKKDERAAIYLTNALTGWEPPKAPKTKLLFPELEEERDAAEQIKQAKPILVILGNPPYNGYAGLAVSEERDLSNAYRTTKRAPAPQGQGLNDLYVRFFRMAERRITEISQEGVICFISNYSWLDGLSFTGMREKYLESFDKIWIDNLHGDRIISEYAPDGRTSETVFAVGGKSPGIKIGTAIATLVTNPQKNKQEPHRIFYRDADQARAAERTAALLESLNRSDFNENYQQLKPIVEIGLPFKLSAVSGDYLAWPLLPKIFPVSFPGVKTARDESLVDIDRKSLENRMLQYFDPANSHEQVTSISPTLMEDTARFEAKSVRSHLLKRGFLPENIVRYCYRPFDVRWLYWEPETKLLDEKRTEYFKNSLLMNPQIAAAQRIRKGFEASLISPQLCSFHVIESGANLFPLFLKPEQKQHSLFEQPSDNEIKPNLSAAALSYGEALGAQASRLLFASVSDANDLTEGSPEEQALSSPRKRAALHALAAGETPALPGNALPSALFFHAVAILHAPAYRQENSGALRQDWPRIPLPANQEALFASAELGKQIAALLDTETLVVGVTSGTIRPELKTIAVIAHTEGKQLSAEDLQVTAGWGHGGKGGITMPGKGKAVLREITEQETHGVQALAWLYSGEKYNQAEACTPCTFDIFLNNFAYWRNVPERVWEYTIGGYQVMKKWLSYRELELLGRALTIEEVREVTNMARRIAAILWLEAELDENYQDGKANVFEWVRNE